MYAIIINFLKYFSIINYGDKISVYNIFIAPFTTHGNQYFFNVASWFVITLFFIQILYMSIFKIIRKSGIKSDIFLLIIFIIFACYSLKIERVGINYTIIRIMFLLPFYQIGKIYKSKIEKYDVLSNKMYFIILLLFQTILLQTGDLTYNLNLLTINRNYIIYLLASITGIAFWLRVSKILTNYIGESRVIDYIGNNTFTIMMNHVFAYFILNTCAIIISRINIGILDNININEFKENVWFVICQHNNVGINSLYIIFAIAFPLLSKLIYQKYINVKIMNICKKCKGVTKKWIMQKKA